MAMPLGGVASEAGSDSDGGASDAVVLTLGRRPPTETLGLVPRGGRDSTTFARGAGAGTPGVGVSAFAVEAGAGAAGGSLHVPPDSDDEGAEPAHSQLGRGVARLPRETQCPAPGGGVGSTMPARGAVADAARLGVAASRRPPWRRVPVPTPQACASARRATTATARMNSLGSFWVGGLAPLRVAGLAPL